MFPLKPLRLARPRRSWLSRARSDPFARCLADIERLLRISRRADRLLFARDSRVRDLVLPLFFSRALRLRLTKTLRPAATPAKPQPVVHAPAATRGCNGARMQGCG